MPVSPSLGQAYGRQIAGIVGQAELSLLRLIADAIRGGGDAEQVAWLHAKLAELQRLRQKITATASALDFGMAREVRRIVLDAYNAGSSLAVKDLDRLGVTAVEAADPVAAAQSIASQLAKDLHAAALQLPDMLTSVYQAAVHAGADQVLGGTVTRIDASQSVLDDLLGQGIRGFIDSAGRSWGLDTYAEMAVRTATAYAAISGHVATLQASDVDLVIISDHGGSCPLCEPWEGKILSTSGDTTGAVAIAPNVVDGGMESVDVAGTLDEATAEGLFHPNCAHTADAYLPGATDAADDAGVTPAPSELDAAQSSDGSAEYQATQRQRAIERNIRTWKRRGALALDDTTAAQATVKVKQWQAVMRDHVDANDLRRLSSREQIGKAH